MTIDISNVVLGKSSYHHHVFVQLVNNVRRNSFRSLYSQDHNYYMALPLLVSYFYVALYV